MASRRIVAFSPATAVRTTSVFDHGEEHQHSEVSKLSQAFEDGWESTEKVTKAPPLTPRCGRLVEPQVPGVFCMSPPSFKSNWRDPKRAKNWQNFVHRIPIVRVIQYLDNRACARLFEVSRGWRDAISSEQIVFKILYARKCSPQMLGKSSYAMSWKNLLRGGEHLSISRLLRWRHDSILFDFGPQQRLHFEASQVNRILGQPRAPIVACLEVLPGFFWTVLQTSSGFLHAGILVRNGYTVPERGMDIARSYIRSLKGTGLRAANLRSIVLLLSSLQALPPNLCPNAMFVDENCWLDKDPFRLRLHVSRRQPKGSYFFNSPRRTIISPTGSMACDSTSWTPSPGDENCPPESLASLDGFWTLEADEAGELEWNFTKCSPILQNFVLF